MTRKAHFVGSLPPELATNEKVILRWYADAAAGHPVTALPCDADPDWIVGYLRHLATRDAFTITRDGSYRDYGDMPKLSVRPGRTLREEDVTMHRGPRIARVMAAMTELQSERRDLANVKVQLSQPNPLDASLFTFGGDAIDAGMPIARVLKSPTSIATALAYLPTFTRAALTEVREVTAQFGDRIIWQVESPTALLGALKAHQLHLHHATIPALASQLASFLTAVHRTGANTSLHLCYGDYKHESLLAPNDLRPAVDLLNATAQKLRRARTPLPTAHVPCAFGAAPAPTTERFYAPLRQLDPQWSLIAGVVSPGDQARSAAALEMFETASNRTAVGVATACGFGRCSARKAQIAAGATVATSKGIARAAAA